MPTSTIGTASRDYSTISAWEADLGAGSQVGECYDDSAFDESCNINDADPDDITLTVASGERHDGTAGTGVRIVRTGDGNTINLNVSDTSLKWLEIDGASSKYNQLVQTDVSEQNFTIANLLCHGFDGHSSWDGTVLRLRAFGGSDNSQGFNCIVYGVESTRDSDNYGIVNQYDTFSHYNHTIHDISNTTASDGVGFKDLGNSTASQNYQNIVATNCDVCFDLLDSDPTRSHNASSDGTASGTGSLTNIDVATVYVSTVDGSQDLHLQDSDSPLFEAGTDLGTTPSGVEVDIDGYDRDAGATTWSIGAHDGNNLRVTGGPFPHYIRRLHCGGMVAC